MMAKIDYSSDEFWAKQRKNEYADQTLRAETIGEKTLFIWSVQHEYNGCLNDDVEFSAWIWSNNIVKLGFGYLEVELKMALMTAYIPVTESDHYFAEENLNGVFKALKEKYAQGKLAVISPLERWAGDLRSYLKGNPDPDGLADFFKKGQPLFEAAGLGNQPKFFKDKASACTLLFEHGGYQPMEDLRVAFQMDAVGPNC
jgi:hypothetical protein